MLVELHDKADVRGGLTHLIDQDHLPDHQRCEEEADSKTAHNDKGEPRDSGSCLHLDNPGLKMMNVQ